MEDNGAAPGLADRADLATASVACTDVAGAGRGVRIEPATQPVSGADGGNDLPQLSLVTARAMQARRAADFIDSIDQKQTSASGPATSAVTPKDGVIGRRTCG